MKKTIILFFIIISIGLISCGKSSEIAQPEQIQIQPQENVVVEEDLNIQPEIEETFQPETTAAKEQVKEFTVHGASFEFDKQEIRVKKGDKVRIIYISDDIGHDLVIDEFNVRTNVITKGQTEVTEFVADKEGTFAMYCSVGQHRQLGMESRLIVEP